MRSHLTVKQMLFVDFLLGEAHGNQTAAARMAGYRGDARQLAVQASVNMKNAKIRELISSKLASLVEPSLSALQDGLGATRQKVFLTKEGEILYAAPEADHKVRISAATRILNHYQRTSSGDTCGSDDDVAPGGTGVLELPSPLAPGSIAEHCGDDGIHVVDKLDSADRDLLQQVERIDAQLATLDTESDEADGER